MAYRDHGQSRVMNDQGMNGGSVRAGLQYDDLAMRSLQDVSVYVNG
jgi:hypothetical protein